MPHKTVNKERDKEAMSAGGNQPTISEIAKILHSMLQEEFYEDDDQNTEIRSSWGHMQNSRGWK